jgi:hypothetical protein
LSQDKNYESYVEKVAKLNVGLHLTQEESADLVLSSKEYNLNLDSIQGSILGTVQATGLAASKVKELTDAFRLANSAATILKGQNLSAEIDALSDLTAKQQQYLNKASFGNPDFYANIVRTVSTNTNASSLAFGINAYDNKGNLNPEEFLTGVLDDLLGPRGSSSFYKEYSSTISNRIIQQTANNINALSQGAISLTPDQLSIILNAREKGELNKEYLDKHFKPDKQKPSSPNLDDAVITTLSLTTKKTELLNNAFQGLRDNAELPLIDTTNRLTKSLLEYNNAKGGLAKTITGDDNSSGFSYTQEALSLLSGAGAAAGTLGARALWPYLKYIPSLLTTEASEATAGAAITDSAAAGGLATTATVALPAATIAAIATGLYFEGTSIYEKWNDYQEYKNMAQGADLTNEIAKKEEEWRDKTRLILNTPAPVLPNLNSVPSESITKDDMHKLVAVIESILNTSKEHHNTTKVVASGIEKVVRVASDKNNSIKLLGTGNALSMLNPSNLST